MTGPHSGGQGAPKGPAGPRERLKTRSEFLAVAKGRRAHAPAFSVQGLARPSPEADSAARFGLTVTKKVGTATERNRIRRRLRALLRNGKVAGRPDHDYVIVARRDALTLPFDRLGDALRRLIGNIDTGRSASGRKSRQGRGSTDTKDQASPT
jgi:ribonuclease P protein component